MRRPAPAAWFGSVPAVPASCRRPDPHRQRLQDQRHPELRPHPFLEDAGRQCGGGRECVPYRDWVAGYQAVQSGQLSASFCVDLTGRIGDDPPRFHRPSSTSAAPCQTRRSPSPSRFRAVSRHYRRGEGRRRCQLRHPGRRVLRHARAVRLGQDHLPAPDRRLRAADRRQRRSSTARTWRACRPTTATSTPCSRITRCSRT